MKDFRVYVVARFAMDVGALDEWAAQETAEIITRSVFEEYFERAEELEIDTEPEELF